MKLPGFALRILCASSLLLLSACESLDFSFGIFGGDEAPPPARPPANVVITAITEPPPLTAPVFAADMPVMEMWAAERIADRFITLHRLVQDSLLERSRYNAWMNENEGAFLLLTAPPPVKGLSAKIPRYEDVADYLRRIKQDRADVGAAERAALLDSLMPSSGMRMAKMQPPKGKDFDRWVALLDRLATAGALPADKVAREKQVLALLAAPASP